MHGLTKRSFKWTPCSSNIVGKLCWRDPNSSEFINEESNRGPFGLFFHGGTSFGDRRRRSRWEEDMSGGSRRFSRFTNKVETAYISVFFNHHGDVVVGNCALDDTSRTNVHGRKGVKTKINDLVLSPKHSTDHISNESSIDAVD